MTRTLRGLPLAAATLLALVVVALTATSARTEEGPVATPGTQAVLFVANNWDGTADIVDPNTFAKLGRFNVIPDLDERLAEIYTDPVRLGYFLAIRQLVGEGNDQWADDMFSSHDGRYVYISRPSLADVIGMDLQTKKIVWRFPMEGQRADHMAISPDGTRVLVSDSTANKVHVLNTADGKKVGEFLSGDSPHENNYSKDGTRIFHASIGLVYTPLDQPAFDTTKGERWFQVVDAQTNKILKRLDIGQIMEDSGYPDMSSAVRPMAISPDEKTFYLQLSFLHGFVVFDLASEKPLRVVELPRMNDGANLPREMYLLDSAHHGLAINPAGTKLCAAGTMSDYAAIVSTSDFSYKIFESGSKPYWATNSGDGRYCFVSMSGDDRVVVLDYETEREVARIDVGDHPQRMRMGLIRSEFLGLPSTETAREELASLHVRRARVANGRLELRLRVSPGVEGRLRGTYAANGMRKRFSLEIPAASTWTARLPLPAGQRRARTGTLELAYSGDDAVLPGSLRLRTAPRQARLRVTRTAVDRQGRLSVNGTVARRARGEVTVRLGYVGEGTRVRVLRYRARIARGRWRIRGLLPTQAARSGGQLSIQYTGDMRRRIRGEHLIRRLAP